MAAQCFSYTKYLNPAPATLATPFPKAARTCRLVVAASSPKDVALQSKGRDRYIPGKVKAERVYWEFPGVRVLLSSGAPVSSRGPSLPINIPIVETLLDSVKWDEKGLAVAIAQNVDTGAVLMQGFANRDALATTISSRKATFYSRSRSSLWTKGETSSNFINVHDVFLDCDRDSIIYLGKPDGPTCHTGSETCYYTSVLDLDQKEDNKLASTTLYALETTISDRKAELALQDGGKPSWTKKLLVDHKLLCSKLREEADELCRTLEENEDEGRTASEMGDVLYHAMVLLALKGVKMEDVLEDLRKRFSQSGIEEKRGRSLQSRS